MMKKPALQIVQLHDGRPSLADTVGRLRLLADQIESGEFGEVTGVFVLLPRPRDFPRFFGFGAIDESEPIVQLELAKHWLAANLVTR